MDVVGTWVKLIVLTEVDRKRCPLWDLGTNGMYADMQAVFLAVFCMIFANLYACHSTHKM